MAGLTPKFDDGDIGRFYDRFQKDAEKKFIEVFVYAGELGVKRARISGKYNDITGNLRSSIGYAVIRAGEVEIEAYEKASGVSDGEKGIDQSYRLIHTLASKFNKGIILILVAGMDYALAVESIEGKDVIAGAVTYTDKFLRDTIKEVLKNG
jgi:hypothetical protein